MAIADFREHFLNFIGAGNARAFAEAEIRSVHRIFGASIRCGREGAIVPETLFPEYQYPTTVVAIQ